MDGISFYEKLYSGGGIQIWKTEGDSDSHLILLDEVHGVYAREGILRKLAEKSSDELEADLERMNPRFYKRMKDSGISGEYFRNALREAREAEKI